MSVKFQIDYSDFERLTEKFKKIPNETEKVINSYLHQEGVNISKRDIIARIPVSKKKGKLKHAKFGNPLRHKPLNLGFEISPYPRFNYLVFPDQALGTSKGKSPQKFMHKGMDDSTAKVIEGLTERIDEKIKEVLS